MTYVEQDFTVAYELTRARINTVAEGKLQNGSSYKSSVKITSQNVFEVINEKTGFVDTKSIELVIKIGCVSDSQAGLLAAKIKEYYLKTKKLNFVGGIANNGVVTLAESADYYLEHFTNLLRDLNKKDK